ncbi:hypothetical protein V1514DRAFT_323666 [Lipomyces japonicus]|uniref:uncharacterized protein n=1 Tax=Lipomyces japonicus TaxID=56871 RepID=UPI0034CDDA26
MDGDRNEQSNLPGDESIVSHEAIQEQYLNPDPNASESHFPQFINNSTEHVGSPVSTSDEVDVSQDDLAQQVAVALGIDASTLQGADMMQMQELLTAIISAAGDDNSGEFDLQTALSAVLQSAEEEHDIGHQLTEQEIELEPAPTEQLEQEHEQLQEAIEKLQAAAPTEQDFGISFSNIDSEALQEVVVQHVAEVESGGHDHLLDAVAHGVQELEQEHAHAHEEEHEEEQEHEHEHEHEQELEQEQEQEQEQEHIEQSELHQTITSELVDSDIYIPIDRRLAIDLQDGGLPDDQGIPVAVLPDENQGQNIQPHISTQDTAQADDEEVNPLGNINLAELLMGVDLTDPVAAVAQLQAATNIDPATLLQAVTTALNSILEGEVDEDLSEDLSRRKRKRPIPQTEEEKLRLKLDNRLRKQRWRELNEERNKDNDLRGRVMRRADIIFGKENLQQKMQWIDQEFSRRRQKRLKRLQQKSRNSGDDGIEGIPAELLAMLQDELASLLQQHISSNSEKPVENESDENSKPSESHNPVVENTNTASDSSGVVAAAAAAAAASALEGIDLGSGIDESVLMEAVSTALSSIISGVSQANDQEESARNQRVDEQNQIAIQKETVDTVKEPQDESRPKFHEKHNEGANEEHREGPSYNEMKLQVEIENANFDGEIRDQTALSSVIRPNLANIQEQSTKIPSYPMLPSHFLPKAPKPPAYIPALRPDGLSFSGGKLNTHTAPIPSLITSGPSSAPGPTKKIRSMGFPPMLTSLGPIPHASSRTKSPTRESFASFEQEA